MLGKIILSTLVAGLLAGAVLAGFSYFRLSPLIAAAEVYETAEGTAIAEANKPCVEKMQGMKMCSDEGRPAWEPQKGFEKNFDTSVASLLAGCGFAVFLVGISLLTNIPITKQNGVIWGFCAFLVVAVAPAAGLPPQPPAMPIADLHMRQFWWLGTIAATGIAFYIFAMREEVWSKIAAVALVLMPHAIGAPVPAELSTTLPATIATSFVANSIAAAAVFWSVLGYLLGQLLQKYQKDIAAL